MGRSPNQGHSPPPNPTSTAGRSPASHPAAKPQQCVPKTFRTSLLGQAFSDKSSRTSLLGHAILGSPQQLNSRNDQVRDRTMLKLFPITLLLGLALLFGQGGVVLVAAVCPHLSLASSGCDMPEMTAAMDHSQMAHHDVNHGNP